MHRSARLLEYVIVYLPENHSVFNPRAEWASAGTYIAHSPIHIVASARGLLQRTGQRDISRPVGQRLFAWVKHWIIRLADRVKRGQCTLTGECNRQRAAHIMTGLQTVSNTHRYAAEKFAASLAVAQALCQEAENISQWSLAQEMAFHHLSCAYLQSMVAVVDRGGTDLMDGLANHHLLASQGDVDRSRIDMVSEAYLQHVRHMLERKENVHDEKGVKSAGFGTASSIW